ncbi:MAG: isoprenylcysteine carboxylmethyltransferase family protein [Xanthobacteraceae bacterium]
MMVGHDLMDASSDTPGVIAPPPVIYAAAVAAGLVLDSLFPVYVLATLLYGADRVIIGIAVIIGGVALAVSAFRTLRAVGTNPEPWKPTLALVTTGVFRYLRNPMYVGMTLMVIGLAIALASDWMLVALIPAAMIVHYGVILREERYLERKFGEPYRLFQASVPRYGWPG